MLQVKTIPTGPIQANCYLIYNDKDLLIIDPGNDADNLKQAIDQLAKQPVAILLTHAHYDHIGALENIRNTYHIPVYASPYEINWLTDPQLNLSGLGNPNQADWISGQPADHLWEEKDYQLADFNFSVKETPGHSPGGVSFVFDSFVITGDALFAGSIGRTDLPFGDSQLLLDSIKEKLFTLPDNYIVYPGHGGRSTIGNEEKTNPFFH